MYWIQINVVHEKVTQELNKGLVATLKLSESRKDSVAPYGIAKTQRKNIV